jgi:hypothetical protein
MLSTVAATFCSNPTVAYDPRCPRRWWFTGVMSAEAPTPDHLTGALRSGAHEDDVEHREAAVAEREIAVADREADVADRETDVADRETAQAQRLTAAGSTLAAAAERDAVSDTRDALAEKRSNDADLVEMLDPSSEYGAYWPERRHAAGDRRHAKDDRTASRDDRLSMTEGPEEQHTDV